MYKSKSGSARMQWLGKEVVEVLKETAEVLSRRKGRKKECNSNSVRHWCEGWGDESDSGLARIHWLGKEVVEVLRETAEVLRRRKVKKKECRKLRHSCKW